MRFIFLFECIYGVPYVPYVSCHQVPVHPDQPDGEPKGRGLFRHRPGNGHSIFRQVAKLTRNKWNNKTILKIAEKLKIISQQQKS